MELREYQKNIIKETREFMQSGVRNVLIQSPVGCIDEDSIIRLNKNKKGYFKTISKAYKGQFDKRRNNSKTFIRALDKKNEKINLSSIDSITYSGEKECIKLISKSKNLILTPDHLIFTKNGWVPAYQMLNKEWGIDNHLAYKKNNIKKRYHDRHIDYLTFHKKARIVNFKRDGKTKTIEYHRAIYEAHINNLSLENYIYILRNDKNRADKLWFLNTKTHCIHHLDGNHINNNINNLTHITIQEHKNIHKDDNIKNFNQGTISWEKVDKICYVGIRKTYDVIGSETDSFTANDIIVHNSGKTILTAHMLKTASSKGLTSWFICHRRELIKQSILAFSDTGVNHGVISSGWNPNKNLPVQIASIQTLVRRYKQYKKPNLIVWDESHHCASKTWARVHAENPQAYHIGLTATPQRLDGAGLKDYFQAMVSGLTTQELISQGYLSKYKLFAPSKVNTSKVHTRMGDFVKSEIEALIDKPTITGDAIKHYKKLCMGKRAVVFCSSIKHSEHVVDSFVNAGIKACHLDGESQKGYRDLMLDKFRKGDIDVISNVDLFGEGFDLPTLEAVIMLRPTQSLSLFIQQCGRCLRPSPGKEYAIILDHAGNTERHGLPDEDREWTLEGNKGNKTDQETQIKVKTCPKCYAVQLSGKTMCDFCGHTYEIKEREIAHVDGDLVEVDYEMLRKQKRRDQGVCQTKEDLIQLGIKRGYKRPRLWAQFIWNARQRKKGIKK